MTEKLNASTTPFLDDDVPELSDDFFRQAHLYHGNTLLRQGNLSPEATQQLTTLPLDVETLTYFQALGKDWQIRINHALKEWIATQQT